MRKKVFFTILSVLLFVLGSLSISSAYSTIGEEDRLQISVWGYPELTVTVPVRPGGLISVPFVGEVKAAGLTSQELKDVLEKEFTKFIKTPSVSVVITEVNSFKVFVLGAGLLSGSSDVGSEASAPTSGTTSGVITLKRDTSLLQLIAMLGFRPDADYKNAYLLREGKKIEVNFYNLVVKGDTALDLMLKPDDVIFVPANIEQRIKVVGAVKAPGLVPYTEGMTVLDAILAVGGFNEFASKNNVFVVRKEGDEVKNLRVRMKDVINDGDISQNLQLKPGDLIRVSSGIF